MKGRLSLISLLLLASCAAVAPKPEKIVPPVELLQPCQEPAGRVRTNGELSRYALELLDALRGCNRRMDALREWAQE